MKEVKSEFEAFLENDLAAINNSLSTQSLPELSYNTMADFLDDKVAGQTGGGGKYFRKYFVNHPMGSTWSNIWF